MSEFEVKPEGVGPKVQLIAARVLNYTFSTAKNGKEFCVFTVEQDGVLIKCMCFNNGSNERIFKKSKCLIRDAIYYIYGTLSTREDNVKMNIEYYVTPLEIRMIALPSEKTDVKKQKVAGFGR